MGGQSREEVSLEVLGSPRYLSVSSMKRYWPYLKLFKPVRWQLAGGIIAGLIFAVATGAGLPLATKTIMPLIFTPEGETEADESNWLTDAIERLLGDMEHDSLVVIACLWLPGVFFIRAVSGFLNSYLTSYCGFKVVEQVRGELFAKLQHLPLSFYSQYKAGDLLARLTNDAGLLQATVKDIARDVIKQPFVLVTVFVYLISEALNHQGVFVVLISIVTVPICIMPLRMIAKKLGKRAKLLQKNAGDLSAQISEILQAPMEVRAYNLQGKVIARFENTLKEIVKYSLKVVKYRQLVSPSVEFIAVLGLTITLVIAARQEEVMSLSRFMGIGLALYLSYEPIKKLGAIHSCMKQGEAALDRMEEILYATDHMEEVADPKHPNPFYGGIVLENVVFSYGEEPVLKGISTTIKEGECVAFIGVSGGGKSSLFNLIPRFYDVDSGSVKVSGVDVREWEKKDLRDQIALVSQRPILFKGTIRENILLGREGATETEIIEAAKRANAHDFIMEQERGYETEVSEKGTSLSGGQLQRVAIARAFLKDAPILLLDEATSALDNESEAKIQESLSELIKDRTTLIIAHRLSTTKIANRVIELDQGEVISERPEA